MIAFSLTLDIFQQVNPTLIVIICPATKDKT